VRTYWIADTRSGVYQAQMFPKDGSFKRVLCGSGSGEHIFQLGSGRRTRAQWRALTRPWARTLVVEEDGVIVYAGVIAKRPHKWRSHEFKITHVDIREIFRRRFPFGVAAYWAVFNVIPGKLVITGKSQRAVVAKLVEQSLLGPFATYSLPITIPSTEEAGPITVTYENYLLRSTFDLLDDIQSAQNGPDIDLPPRKVDGKLTWDLDVALPGAPQLVKGSFDFNMTVTEPALFDVSYDEDASDQLTGIYSAGSGSEVDMALGGNGIGNDATIPAIDIVQNYKAEDNKAKLQSYSEAGLVALTHPVIQINASLMSTAKHNLATMPVGTITRMYFRDDEWIPVDGWIEPRIIAYSADMTSTIKVQTQPLVGAI
jgi:hypothetical protein